MALIKSKTLANGAAGNYWKIVSLRIDKMSKVIDVDMKLFKDESHKNGIPLGGDKKFQFQCTNEELLGDVVQLAYEKNQTACGRNGPSEYASTRRSDEALR